MTSREKIEAIVGKQGFSDYRWINPREIVVGQWMRVKCMFGCGNHGLGACPPNTPSVEECDRFFKEYESGLIIRLNKFANKDPYPSDWSKEMTGKLFGYRAGDISIGVAKSILTQPGTLFSLRRLCRKQSRLQR
jgi:predicted metal-binding protein